MRKSLYIKKLIGGGIVFLLFSLILVACTDHAPTNTVRVRIENALAQSAKTIAYDGSLTGGETDINAYRGIVTDNGVEVANSGIFTTGEIVLTGVTPGVHSFTLQGLIQGGGENIVVAETTTEAGEDSERHLLPPAAFVSAS